MSIKLYNGFVFADRTMDMAGALDLIGHWRVDLRDRHTRELAELIARDAVELVDTEALRDLFPGSPEQVSAPASTAWRRIRDRQQEVRRTGHRDPQVDFSFSLTLHPGADGLYGLVFSERDTWVDAFLDDPAITHLPYWDNTDAPDGMSEADWQARRDLWTGLLNRDPWGRPAQAGFTAEMSPPETLGPGLNALVAAQPTLEARLTQMAKRLHVDRQMTHSSAFDTNRILSTIARIDAAMRTEEGQARLDEIRAEIAPRLRTPLTEADLRGA